MLGNAFELPVEQAGRSFAPRVLPSLGPEERLGLVGNQWALAKAGKIAISQLFTVFDGLRSETDRAVLSASGSPGFFHAAASLLQLASARGIRCASIDDAPDFDFRVADWLLNVEANRWGYERGDGRERTIERLRVSPVGCPST